MSFWHKTPPPPPAPAEPQAIYPLELIARGMCCSVGHNAPAATAVINAHMNHFRNTYFTAYGGEPLNAGAMHDLDQWGLERLTLMLNTVIAETLQNIPQERHPAISLVALVAEPERAGLPRELLHAPLQAACQQHQLHPTPHMVQAGKAGLAAALQYTCQVLRPPANASAPQGAPSPQAVLLVGIDSLLDVGHIQAALSQERLLGSDHPEGYIPAEGAAAVLLTHNSNFLWSFANQRPTTSLWLTAASHALDPWRLLDDEPQPQRGLGLTQAIRQTLQATTHQLIDMDFHASGINGEAWYSKEVNLALARCMERKKPDFPQLSLTRSLGETGAASSILMLAWLMDVMNRPTHHPFYVGQRGLLHYADDHGRRSAAIIEKRSASSTAASRH